MTYEGPPITLDAVTYQTASSDGPGTTIRDVAYLGVIARKSDGFTTLSVRKPGAAKAFNIETGRVISITAHGREWRPEAHSSRWTLRAAEVRAFVERKDLEEWARPYFDPQSEKYHGRRPRYDELRSVEDEQGQAIHATVRGVMDGEGLGPLGKLWRWLLGPR